MEWIKREVDRGWPETWQALGPDDLWYTIEAGPRGFRYGRHPLHTAVDCLAFSGWYPTLRCVQAAAEALAGARQHLTAEAIAERTDERDTYACAEYAREMGEEGAIRALYDAAAEAGRYLTGDVRAYVLACVARWATCDDCGAAGATAHGEAKRCSRCAGEVEDESALDASVRIESDDDDPIECTLAEFLDDNEEGLAEGEREAIIAAIARGASYAGGGGAAPSWTLRWIADE